jgi:hypothetical protein
MYFYAYSPVVTHIMYSEHTLTLDGAQDRYALQITFLSWRFCSREISQHAHNFCDIDLQDKSLFRFSTYLNFGLLTLD